MPRPELVRRYNALADEWDARGYPAMRIISVDRGIARQAELYRNRGRPGWPKVVAPPGRSAHNFGAAIDLQVQPRYHARFHDLARRHGLFPLGSALVKDDPGHLQLPNALWRSRRG